MRVNENIRGSSVLELLCSILLIAVLGGLAVSVLLTSIRRARAIDELDQQRRRSERVFGTVSDGVRAQREAPGIPLWRVIDEPGALKPWPSSIPRTGDRAPSVQGAMLAFGRVDSEKLWRVARSEQRLELRALPLCRQPLFSVASKSSRTESYFLGIAPDRVILLHGRISRQRLDTAHCKGESALGVLGQGAAPWPFTLRGGEMLAQELGTPSDYIALRPLVDGFILYLDRVGTVRRAALLTSENQPIISEVAAFHLSVNPLPKITEEELVVELVWDEKRNGHTSTERWILPVATLGEQLLGIL